MNYLTSEQKCDSILAKSGGDLMKNLSKNSVYVKEPTFLSPMDLHFRMTNGNNIDSLNRYTISELKEMREVLVKDNISINKR